MERQKMTAARVYARALVKDAEQVLGLVNALEDAETRLEYFMYRKSLKQRLVEMESARENVLANVPRPLTELPAGIVADWQERLDEAWRSSQRDAVFCVVSEAVEAGPSAVERLRAALESRGVDLDELADELGIEMDASGDVDRDGD